MDRTSKAAEGGRGRRKAKGFFVRGLVVVLPAVLTVFVFVTVLQFADRYVAGPINRTIYAALDGNALGWRVLRWRGLDPYDPEFLLPQEEQPPRIARLYVDEDILANVEADQELTTSPAFLASLANERERAAHFLRNHRALGIDHEKLRGAVRRTFGIWAGILIAAGLVLTVGYLASGFLGRSAIAAVDRLVARLPIVRAVYPHAKQLVDFFLAERTDFDFDTVVAAPYPSESVWSIGFVTSKGVRTLHEHLDGQYVAVYVPSSPLPMTGYTVFIEAGRLIPLDINVEQAFRLVVSAGVLVPEGEAVSGLHDTMARLGVPAAARRPAVAGDAPDETDESDEDAGGEPRERVG